MTQHEELHAIRVACGTIGRDNLKDCILYTSCEPCMMCLGACHLAKFKEIFYSASAMDAKDYGFEYSNSYFDIDEELRHAEFNMAQPLREEALRIWK